MLESIGAVGAKERVEPMPADGRSARVAYRCGNRSPPGRALAFVCQEQTAVRAQSCALRELERSGGRTARCCLCLKAITP